MAWETRTSGRFYYHPRRVGGRVVKLYLGNGEAAALMADIVAEDKAARGAEREALRAYLAQLEPLEQAMAALELGCNLVVAAALTAVGYHRYDRGAWRRKRGYREA